MSTREFIPISTATTAITTTITITVVTTTTAHRYCPTASDAFQNMLKLTDVFGPPPRLSDVVIRAKSGGSSPTRAHQPPPCRRQPRTHRARPLSPFAVVDPFCLRQFNGQKEPKVDMTVEAFEQEGTVGHGRAWYGMAWCTCITR